MCCSVQGILQVMLRARVKPASALYPDKRTARWRFLELLARHKLSYDQAKEKNVRIKRLQDTGKRVCIS